MVEEKRAIDKTEEHKQNIEATKEIEKHIEPFLPGADPKAYIGAVGAIDVPKPKLFVQEATQDEIWEERQKLKAVLFQLSQDFEQIDITGFDWKMEREPEEVEEDDPEYNEKLNGTKQFKPGKEIVLTIKIRTV